MPRPGNRQVNSARTPQERAALSMALPNRATLTEHSARNREAGTPATGTPVAPTTRGMAAAVALAVEADALVRYGLTTARVTSGRTGGRSATPSSVARGEALISQAANALLKSKASKAMGPVNGKSTLGHKYVSPGAVRIGTGRGVMAQTPTPTGRPASQTRETPRVKSHPLDKRGRRPVSRSSRPS